MSERLRIFVGHDERQGVGLTVFLASLLRHAKRPVDLTVITAEMAAGIGIGTDGTNAFTKSRFAVPYWAGFRGMALWLDGSDMILRADPYAIVEHAQSYGKAVQVVRHEYSPAAGRKYIGTEMEAPNVPYERKNWSSVMLFWCGHFTCRKLTPEYIASHDGQHLHRFQWCTEDQIGELPQTWNWLDEYGAREDAKLVHYTNGIPGFSAYKDAPHAQEWKGYLAMAQRGLQC